MSMIYRILRPIARRWPHLAIAYREFRDRRRLRLPPRDCPLGFKFIGNPAMEAGTFETDDVQIIGKCLGKAQTFINIGANIGYYCCIALKRQIPVVAFEPIALNLQYLYTNIAANGWQDDIEVYPVALADKAGLVEIFGGGTGASLVEGWSQIPAYYRRWTPAITLDKALGQRFCGKQTVILVDIEGAEDRMLAGASMMLAAEPKPIWVVEISVCQHQPSGVAVNPNLLSTFQRFWEHGYEAWTCNRTMRRVEKQEVQSVCRSGQDTLRSLNFLFCAPGIKEQVIGR